MTIAETARAVLNGIVDPCSVAAGAPAGLIDMGLVRDVDIREAATGAHVRVVITTTEPMCLMAGCFLHEARARLSAIDGVSEVDVRLEHGRLWTPDDMQADYRARLDAMRLRNDRIREIA